MPWNTTAPPSTGWPCARMQSVQDAEDVYQDVFLRLLGQEAICLGRGASAGLAAAVHGEPVP